MRKLADFVIGMRDGDAGGLDDARGGGVLTDRAGELATMATLPPAPPSPPPCLVRPGASRHDGHRTGSVDDALWRMFLELATLAANQRRAARDAGSTVRGGSAADQRPTREVHILKPRQCSSSSPWQ